MTTFEARIHKMAVELDTRQIVHRFMAELDNATYWVAVSELMPSSAGGRGLLDWEPLTGQLVWDSLNFENKPPEVF